jgi:hypothetical protein
MEDGLDLGDDGEGDGGWVADAEVEADGAVEAGEGFVEGEAEGGCDLRQEALGAVAWAEDAEVAQTAGEERGEQGAVLLVAVGEDDGEVV